MPRLLANAIDDFLDDIAAAVHPITVTESVVIVIANHRNAFATDHRFLLNDEHYHLTTHCHETDTAIIQTGGIQCKHVGLLRHRQLFFRLE